MLRYIKDTFRLAARWAVKALVMQFRDSLIKRATATPYDPIGDYMLRYWLVPYAVNKHGGSNTGVGAVTFWKRPIAWVFQKLGIAIRIHGIMKSDTDRAYHDHPWNFMSVILDGHYYEHRPVYDKGLFAGNSVERFDAGSVIFRKAGDLHRLELSEGQIAWTLFITGPWLQDWGFVENPGFKTYWREYLESGKRDPAQSVPTAPTTSVAPATEEDHGTWLTARCKDCNNFTHLSRWWMPAEAGLMVKERDRLEAEGRYPTRVDTLAVDAEWCECGRDPIIAHRVKS